MINHIYTVVCSMASIDQKTNNVSLFNILDQLTILDNPKPDLILNISLEVLTTWIRSNSDVPAKGTERLTFLDPSGQSLRQIELGIDLTKYERGRIRFQIDSLPLALPGRYTFRVDLKLEGEENWNFIFDYPLRVNFKPLQTENAERDTALEASNQVNSF